MKMKWLVSLLVMATIVGGCSSSSSEKVTKTCEVDIMGIKEVMKVSATGDKVTKMESKLTMSLSTMGVDRDNLEGYDLNELLDETIKEMYGTLNFKGVDISHEVKGDDVTIKMIINLEKADLKALSAAGLISSVDGKDVKSISMDESVKELEKQGYKCK